MDDIDNITIISGQVKWFDPVKGFGFIVPDDDGADILLHANVLRNFGQSSVADASEIEVKVQQTDRGLQAVEIVLIDAPDIPPSTEFSDLTEFNLSELGTLPLEPARVKWFDKAKGFGFANIFGRDDDIFVHVQVLRRSGLADLQPGEAIGVRVVEGNRGQMALEVLSWDAALK